MILLNEECRLGRKAYWLMAIRSLVPPLVIFAIAIVLAFAAKGITDLIYVVMKLSGPVSAATSNIISVAVNDVVALGFILGAVSLVMSFVTARMHYKNYTFTFEEFGLLLKRGLFRTTEVTIPYRQMQDVDIERGFLHQFTGTARVVINSAGHENVGEGHEETNIILDPIDRAFAEDIRLMLQRKIGVQVVEGEREADREAMEQSVPPTSTPR